MGDVEAEAAHRTWTLPSCPGPNFTHGLQVRSPFETVTAAFYHHAALHPNAIAARDLSQETPRQITYQQLALRATCLGRELTELGVGQGDRVPLIVKRSIDMLTGILAILSCGAQYVPLDGGIASDATVDYVILQTQAKVALCLKSTEHRLAAFNQRVKIRTIEDQDDKRTAGGEPPIYLDFAKADGGCYVIYTSGASHPHPLTLRCEWMQLNSRCRYHWSSQGG
jgi:non-ribosomal peptide synthetase component F